jgi:hypothetical protein
MFARLITFDGPRSPEFSAAADRAGQNRIMPMLAADPVVGPAHRGTYVLQAADGGRIVLVLLANEAALEHAEKLVNASELRPDEDPALLPGPDRITTYKVAHAFAPDFTEIRPS